MAHLEDGAAAGRRQSRIIVRRMGSQARDQRAQNFERFLWKFAGTSSLDSTGCKARHGDSSVP